MTLLYTPEVLGRMVRNMTITLSFGSLVLSMCMISHQDCKKQDSHLEHECYDITKGDRFIKQKWQVMRPALSQCDDQQILR